MAGTDRTQGEKRVSVEMTEKQYQQYNKMLNSHEKLVEALKNVLKDGTIMKDTRVMVTAILRELGE